LPVLFQVMSFALPAFHISPPTGEVMVIAGFGTMEKTVLERSVILVLFISVMRIKQTEEI